VQSQTFSVPIVVEMGVRKKKNYYLNLNSYRNWQFQLSNSIKKAFKILVADDIRSLDKVTKPCKVTYVIYYPTKRAFDIDNIGSVVTKFTHDALVELDIIEDDNHHFIKEIVYRYGGLDKESPRCDVTIEEYVE